MHLLRDRARTQAYRAAINRQAPGRRVLDIGTGSGILACFAARAGATRVYAIERTSIIKVAIELAATNGLADRIRFIRGDSTAVRLPMRVDLVVSELLSNDLFGQRLVPVLADARDRFLNPGGSMIPRAVILSVAGMHSERFCAVEAAARRLDAVVTDLADAYDLDLQPLLRALEARDVSGDRSWQDRAAAGDRILTEPAVVWRHEFIRGTGEHGGIFPVRLVAIEDGTLNGVAAFWTAVLDGETTIGTALGVPPGAWTRIVHRVPARGVRAGTIVTVGVQLDPMADAPVRVVCEP